MLCVTCGLPHSPPEHPMARARCIAHALASEALRRGFTDLCAVLNRLALFCDGSHRAHLDLLFTCMLLCESRRLRCEPETPVQSKLTLWLRRYHRDVLQDKGWTEVAGAALRSMPTEDFDAEIAHWWDQLVRTLHEQSEE